MFSFNINELKSGKRDNQWSGIFENITSRMGYNVFLIVVEYFYLKECSLNPTLKADQGTISIFPLISQ